VLASVAGMSLVAVHWWPSNFEGFCGGLLLLIRAKEVVHVSAQEGKMFLRPRRRSARSQADDRRDHRAAATGARNVL
jgi:hypothetical protein